MSAPLLVVDGPFLMYRSFFAMPDSITGAEGKPVGALLGSVNLLLRAAADRSPRAIVICFGAEAGGYRSRCTPGITPTGRRRRTRWPGSSTGRRACSRASAGSVDAG